MLEHRFFMESNMQTSRFQLGLMCSLALCLGYVLAAQEAVGYPAGAAVSYGTVPIRSYAGTIAMDSSVVLDTIPDDQDFIVTDISLGGQSLDFDCIDLINIDLTTSAGPVASFSVSTAYCSSGGCSSDSLSGVNSLRSGVRVPSGETLSLTSSQHNAYTLQGCYAERNSQTRYTISGYFSAV